jgi:hypothetical protein
MDGRRGGKLMQRAAGQPAAEGPVDRIGQPNEPLLAGEAGGIARINFRQGLAETVQRGLWRSRAHGNLSGLFTICSKDSGALLRSQAP